MASQDGPVHVNGRSCAHPRAPVVVVSDHIAVSCRRLRNLDGFDLVLNHADPSL
jgi:hypothetical protein